MEQPSNATPRVVVLGVGFGGMEVNGLLAWWYGEGVLRPIGHLFLFIGAEPNTKWLSGSGVALDEKGFVLTGPAVTQNRRLLETNLRGIFAVGDFRSGSIKRVAAAVGEGAHL
jgi:thioredoxin reductase (NADPH)